MFARFGAGILLGLCLIAGADAAVILELKTAAVQRTMTLQLGDVAGVDGKEAPKEELREIVLPSKGKVGDTVTYTRDELTQYIGGTHPEWSSLLHWSGADRVLVQRQGVTVDPAEYVGWAREYLLAHWQAKGGSFAVRPINEYRALTIPEGRRSVSARLDADEVRRTSKVWLDIAVDNRYYTSAAVIFDVRWLHSAWVLKARGSARQSLSEAMLSNADVDISLTNGTLQNDVKQIIGKRLRHDMEAGLPLGAGDIEDKPAVELGSLVEIYTRVGRVLIRTQAVAQHDGQVGQRIGVKNPQTNEQLTVDVIGENRAVVSNNQQH